MSISTHALDLVRGAPAAGLAVRLERASASDWIPIAAGSTDSDGRIKDLVPKGSEVAGRYRIRFDTGAWFAANGVRGFYPWVEVVFDVPPGDAHYHVPLLLGPYGYSTYRGS